MSIQQNYPIQSTLPSSEQCANKKRNSSVLMLKKVNFSFFRDLQEAQETVSKDEMVSNPSNPNNFIRSSGQLPYRVHSEWQSHRSQQAYFLPIPQPFLQSNKIFNQTVGMTNKSGTSNLSMSQSRLPFCSSRQQREQICKENKFCLDSLKITSFNCLDSDSRGLNKKQSFTEASRQSTYSEFLSSLKSKDSSLKIIVHPEEAASTSQNNLEKDYSFENLQQDKLFRCSQSLHTTKNNFQSQSAQTIKKEYTPENTSAGSQSGWLTTVDYSATTNTFLRSPLGISRHQKFSKDQQKLMILKTIVRSNSIQKNETSNEESHFPIPRTVNTIDSSIKQHFSRTLNQFRIPSLSREQKDQSSCNLYQNKDLNLSSKCVSVLDIQSGEFLLNIKGSRPSEVASLTKIMVCFIVCDLLQRTQFRKSDPVKITLSQSLPIKIGKAASQMIGTSAQLRHGDEITLWGLLHGLMLPSGNDAAFAISEKVGCIMYENSPEQQLKKGTSPSANCHPKEGYKEFINTMNLYAEKMKLKSTRFQNAHGLSNCKNKSSASDICLVIQQGMNNNFFKQVVSCKNFSVTVNNPLLGAKTLKWENTNKLLHQISSCVGIKTGVTPAAGPCLATAFCLDQRKFAIVILKAPSMELRFKETIIILKWIANNQNLALSDDILKYLQDQNKQQAKTKVNQKNNQSTDNNQTRTFTILSSCKSEKDLLDQVSVSQEEQKNSCVESAPFTEKSNIFNSDKMQQI